MLALQPPDIISESAMLVRIHLALVAYNGIFCGTLKVVLSGRPLQ